MLRITRPITTLNRRTGRRWKMDATMSQPYAWVCLMPLGMMRCDSTLAEVRSDHRGPSPKQLNPDTACPFAGRIVDGMRRPHPPKMADTAFGTQWSDSLWRRTGLQRSVSGSEFNVDSVV